VIKIILRVLGCQIRLQIYQPISQSSRDVYLSMHHYSGVFGRL
jgi:hypothetical protein